MGRRPVRAVHPATQIPVRGLLWAGFALLGGLFALHLYRLGVFQFPFLMDDYIYAYWIRFGRPVPEWVWSEPLLPFLRPIPYYVLWPLALSVGQGGAAASHLLAFGLVTAAGGFQLAFWKRMAAGLGESLTLVACFFLAAWQVALVGWSTALSDSAAVLGVSAALYFAISGRLPAALLSWGGSLLSKQTALIVTPVLVVLAIQAARARGGLPRARRSVYIGSIVAGLAFALWSAITWLLAVRNPDAGRAVLEMTPPRVSQHVLAPLLSVLNLADLPVPPSAGRVDPWVPAGVVVLVVAAAALSRGRTPDGVMGSRRPLLLAWAMLAFAVALGALLMPYPWSSYLIAPTWPAIVLPLLLVRGWLRTASIALLLGAFAFGASIQALPVTRNDAGVAAVASYHSAGRFLSLAGQVRPVEEAAMSVSEGGAREYFVKGLVKNAWIGFGSGVSGALWAGDPKVRAYSPEESIAGPDLSVHGGYLIHSGTLFGGETTAIAYADYRELSGWLDALVAMPAAEALRAFRSLRDERHWISLAPWVRDRLIVNAAMGTAEGIRQATADTLIQVGWELYTQTQCGHAVAARFLEHGDLSEAQFVLEDLVQNARDRGDTHFLLAVIQSRQQRLALARQSLERARHQGVTRELEPQASQLDRYLTSRGYPQPTE